MFTDCRNVTYRAQESDVGEKKRAKSRVDITESESGEKEIVQERKRRNEKEGLREGNST